MTFVRVGSLFLRTGNKVVAPPLPGGLVVLGRGPTATWLQGTLPSLAGGGTGVGLKSLVWLSRMKVDDIRTAVSPGGSGSVHICTVGSAIAMLVGGAAGSLGITSSFLGATNAGPTLGVTPVSVATAPANGGFVWTYAFIDYTAGGSGNCEIGTYLLNDAGTVIIGQTVTAAIGSGTPYTDPTQLLVQAANYAASSIGFPGAQTIDGFAIFGSIAGSCQLTGAARNTPPSPTAPYILASYGFAGVFTPDQPGVVAPLVPTATGGGATSAVFIPGGIFN